MFCLSQFSPKAKNYCTKLFQVNGFIDTVRPGLNKFPILITKKTGRDLREIRVQTKFAITALKGLWQNLNLILKRNPGFQLSI